MFVVIRDVHQRFLENDEKKFETHETLERDGELARGSDRGVGLVRASVFVLFWNMVTAFRRRRRSNLTLIVAVFFFAAAMVRPSVLGPFNTAIK